LKLREFLRGWIYGTGTFYKPFLIRANASKISEDFPPQKGAKKRKKEDLPDK